MRNNESSEDIYNSLPVDLFTNDLDEFETNSFGSEIENYSSELDSDDCSIDTTDISSKGTNEPHSANNLISEVQIKETKGISDNLSQINLELKTLVISENETIAHKNSSQVDDGSSTMWIRCVRCGKKNEIDCNFCGKCGLQIHKTILIEEPAAEEELSPEVTRNIKYHYKRPVFCFGPKGNCFTSFSSPSKSVRNVSKFQLTVLREFRDSVSDLKKRKIIPTITLSIWDEKELSDQDWSQHDSILKSITIMISASRSFLLDEALRSNLREYFASISPKDLGSIKLLATQDSVSYLRNEIDQIFHLLVIGKTKEACELCITFNYWDHALIIAKTLDVSFYESVMNRFLDSRFANGHPLRILYLIMTNNEAYALEEIRNMISNQDMPLFVQDVWTILVNFLLRAKHESLVIAKIFEDIAKCLFDRKLFENALVCFIISVLSGSKTPNPEVLQKIDYLISWFLLNQSDDILNFAAVHILNALVKKIDSLNSKVILWRCQFIRLSYSQFLHDFGNFDLNALNLLNEALDFSKKMSGCGLLNLLVEESSIIEARNLVKMEKKQFSAQIDTPIIDKPSIVSKKSTEYSPTEIKAPISPSYLPSSVPHKEEYIPLSATSQDNSNQSPGYVPMISDDLISDNTSKFLSNPRRSIDSDKNMADDFQSSSNSRNPQNVNSKLETGNVLNKLRSWLPAVKTTAQNQDNQKQITVAKMGKPNSFRYDEVLKKWVDDNDPSTLEVAPKLPPPPTIGVSSSPTTGQAMSPATGNINFRAKKGKVKYFDPLNPEGPSSTQLQPSVPNFD